MIRTSNIKYILTTKQNYEHKPLIPIKSENGKLLCLSFMSPDTERFIWIERHELSKGEYTQLQLI